MEQTLKMCLSAAALGFLRESWFVFDSRLVMKYVLVHLGFDKTAVLSRLERAADVESSTESIVALELVEIPKSVDATAEVLELCPRQ